MLGCALAICEKPCGLQSNIDSQLRPGQFSWVSYRKNPYLLSVNKEAVRNKLHFGIDLSKNRVKLEEVSKGLRICHIVDSHDFRVDLRLSERANESSPYSPKTVYPDLHDHFSHLSAVRERSEEHTSELQS